MSGEGEGQRAVGCNAAAGSAQLTEELLVSVRVRVRVRVSVRTRVRVRVGGQGRG